MADEDKPKLKLTGDGEIEGGLPLPENNPKKKKGIPTLWRKVVRNPVIAVLSRILFLVLSLLGCIAGFTSVKLSIDNFNNNRCPTQVTTLSMRGNRIVFTSVGNDKINVIEKRESRVTKTLDPQYNDVYVMDADGSNFRRLTNDKIADWDPVLSPDGTHVAFISIDDTNSETKYTVSVINADGSNQQLLAEEHIKYPPAWSPDSKQIALILTDAQANKSAIYIVDLESLARHKLVDVNYSTRTIWLPDGKSIVYFVQDTHTVYTIDVDGSNQRAYTLNHKNPVLDISLSPDGKQLVFIDPRSIYVMNVDGSDKRLVVDNVSTLMVPVWSPDGQQIAFVSATNQNTQQRADVYIAKVNDSNQPTVAKITETYGFNWFANWLPDGKRMVMFSKQDIAPDTSGGLYIVNADGFNPQQLCARWFF